MSCLKYFGSSSRLSFIRTPRAAKKPFAPRRLSSAPRRASAQRASNVALLLLLPSIALWSAYNKPIQADERAIEPSVVDTSDDLRGQRIVTYEELQKHASKDDCWVAINGQIYDVTKFLQSHPGGAGVVLKNAGKDATDVYKPIHPPNAITDNLSPEQHIGSLDPDTVPKAEQGPSEAELMEERRKALPSVLSIINLDDFERTAEQVLGSKSQAWAYYRSAADDELAYERNRSAFSYVNFLPRVMRPVEHCSTETTFFGHKVHIPVFIAPAALARLGHPDGEINLTKGAAQVGGIQCISSNASCSMDEMAQAKDQMAQEGHVATLWFQLYIAKDRQRSENTIRKAIDSGCRAIVLTCDAPVGGKRERDLRTKGDYFDAKLGESNSVSGAQFSYMDPNLRWEDIRWVKRTAGDGVPVILKGVATLEDVALAKEYGADGVVLSNHGGRQLDGSPAPLATLIKMRQSMPELIADKQFEVYIDGGIRRGSDVVKALCLGAKGVGLGRPYLFAQSCYADAGVKRVFDIMEEEIQVTMRLLGANKISDLKVEMVELLDGLLAKPIK